MLRTLLAQSSRSALQSRSLHTTRPALSLQNIFETPDRPSLTISKLTPRGYHLSDDLVVPGGLVLAGYQALLWDVDPPKGDGSGGLAAAWQGWTKERFQVFETVVPRPGMLDLATSGPTVCMGIEADNISRDLAFRHGTDGPPGTQGDQRLHQQSGYPARRHGLGQYRCPPPSHASALTFTEKCGVNI